MQRIFVVGIFSIISTIAFAQQPDVSQLEPRFKAANKSGNGCLTLDEAKAGMPRIAQNFARIDKVGKGCVTLADIKAAMAGK